jgi:hypothetical protein
MIQRIRELLRAAPFAPFKIKTSDGQIYSIATPDHAAVPPEKFAQVIIFNDSGTETRLSALHIVGVESAVVAP